MGFFVDSSIDWLRPHCTWFLVSLLLWLYSCLALCMWQRRRVYSSTVIISLWNWISGDHSLLLNRKHHTDFTTPKGCCRAGCSQSTHKSALFFTCRMVIPRSWVTTTMLIKWTTLFCGCIDMSAECRATSWGTTSTRWQIFKLICENGRQKFHCFVWLSLTAGTSHCDR